MPRLVSEGMLRARGIAFIELARSQVTQFSKIASWVDRWVFEETTRMRRREHPEAKQKPLRHPRLRQRHAWELAHAYYLTYVALAQVQKVVDALPGDGAPKFPGPEPVREVRNIEEHWEEVDGPSLTAARQHNPAASPGFFAFGGSPAAIGMVTEEEIRLWLAEVEAALRKASIRAGDGELPRPSDLLFQ